MPDPSTMKGIMKKDPLIKGIIASSTCAEEIVSHEISVGEDSTGVACVWIDCHVKEDNQPSKEKVSNWASFKAQVSRKTLDSEVKHCPCIHFVVKP